jgi:hypothetical protein
MIPMAAAMMYVSNMINNANVLLCFMADTASPYTIDKHNQPCDARRALL